MKHALPRREFVRISLAALAASQAGRAMASSPANAPATTRLIVRGDDMGCTHAANEAIMRCYREGIETSIEVMVTTPWFPEAVRMLAETPEVDVGVHLTLTSEWDNLKWRPLTPCPSLVEDDGCFRPMVYPHPSYPGRSIRENEWKLAEIEREFRAQIELALRRIPRTSHVSAHMGCTDFAPEVRALGAALRREYGLDIDPAALGVKQVRYVGPKATLEQKTAGFIAMLDGLEPGGVHLFVDHPGSDTPEFQAIHHVGYEDVAVDRQGVTDLWTSPRVRAEIERRNIRLISYRDLLA